MKELEFIETIKKTLSKNSYIGDDCAYLKDLGIVITQDSLVEDIHFSRKFSTPYQLAYKAIIVNLSDIFASGALPKYITIALSLPENIDKNFISEFYGACEDLSKEFKFEIVGGDITGAEKCFISICAIGLTKGRNISSRKYAKVGDYVITTGVHGSSAAGLWLLKKRMWKNPKNDSFLRFFKSDLGSARTHTSYGIAGGMGASRTREIARKIRNFSASSNNISKYPNLIKAHLTPTIQKDFSDEISTKVNRNYAMMDTSDGLMDAVFKIAQASDVSISLDFNKIPYDKEIEDVAKSANVNFEDWIFYGGEDYQLIACVDGENLKKLSVPYTIIGQVEKKNKNNCVEIVFNDKTEKIDNLEKTFNHFKGGK